MKTIMYLVLLIPLMVISQAPKEYNVIENAMLTANPEKIQEFESGMAAHNKKYHAQGIYGARVYWIANGKNAGKYVWVMGPLPWSALDTRPAQEGHDMDWNTNVLPYMLPETEQHYWRFHPELSNFSKDFTIKNLLIFVVDVKRFKHMEFMEVVKKVQKVYLEKMPDHPYGIYINDMANMEGMDFAWVDFFEKSAWMGNRDSFPLHFEEVYGSGSFKNFLKEIEDTTNGESEELWIYKEALSGLGAKVLAASRQ
ncbi:hypothetical protein HCG49_11495 [Arenibacter sp. 6A1]|uniref:hypothetical protein n=1 Tax=Arenibacter sp. 6A1 TaxID=2720391 RepID=UPI001445BF2B|nr:hypothetical protein [Arenibacter sp. 6A1]NKI27187.1 hypothetical protein [Arenibacter sp. 6A1]